MKYTSICFLLGVLFALPLSSKAQISVPVASPSGEVSQKIASANIAVKYQRPSMKEREIFGGLLEYGQLWRTGANRATRVTFSEDVSFDGQEVAAGAYALLTVPSVDKWIIILNSKTNMWGTSGYSEDNDVVRVEVPVVKVSPAVETLSIEVGDIRGFECSLIIRWEDVQVSVPITVSGADKLEE